jgi:hypothetical protein
MSDADDNHRPAPRPATRASPRVAAINANRPVAASARPSSRPATRASPRVAAINANRPVAASADNAKAAASGVAQGGAADDNRRAIPPRHPGGGASVSFPTLLPPIQLEPPPGPRDVVDYDKAVELVKVWNEQLLEHRAKARAALADDDDTAAAHAHPLIVCDRIRLSGKGYTAGAARVIASFIQEPLFDDGSPSLAQGIIVADLSDVMASLLTEEGLDVIRILCDAFADSKLIEVNLSDNAIGEQAIGSCETVLTKKSLERLFLCNAGLSTETMARVADILTRDEGGSGCVAHNLTTLHFAQNMIGDEG